MSASESERDRQLRVADQMMTMHSILRDRYGRRSLILSCVLLALAIVACALVFVGDERLRSWHLAPSVARDLLAWVSVGLLVGTIVELRVDWPGRSRSHAHAVQRLFRLVSLYRSAVPGNGAVAAGLAEEYKRTMDDLAPVPERDFNDLKARHLFKVELSKRISRHPKAWVALLRLQLRLEGIVALRRTHKVDDA